MRNTIEILVWLKRAKITQTKIAKELGMGHCVLISNTIHGKRNQRRVLKWLVDNGCPVKYLDLPGDMKEAA